MVRLALKIFCKNLIVEGRRFLEAPGPALVTANHPNSFLDAIVIGAQFKHPVHFLARGDAFTKPWHGKLLRLLNMIPVYRMSEGKENLGLNESAFRRCKEILASGGIVLIFIEGICVNKHELHPFKKGAARIAAENRRLPGFCIVPVSIAYSSFSRFGKTIHIHLSDPIAANSFFTGAEEAKSSRRFNESLFDIIGRQISIPVKSQSNSLLKSLLLFVPAILGLVIHAPLYMIVRAFVRAKTKGTVFYDSVLFGVLLIVYPVLVCLSGLLLLSVGVPAFAALCAIALLPVLACCAVAYRRS